MDYKIENLQQEIRNLKLKIFIDDFKFSFSEAKIGMLNKELEFISKKLPGDVISGSIALKLYGSF